MEEKKQWETPQQQELRQRIETHPLLQLPAAERMTRQQDRLELIELVMRLKKFDAKLQARLQSAQSALVQDEEEIHAARTRRTAALAGKFDSVTFLICMDKALAGFDAALGTPFLAYFDRIYLYAMHDAVNRQDALNGQDRPALTRREGHLLKEMRRLSEALGYNLKDLPPRYDSELAQSLGITTARLRALLDKAAAVNRFVSMDSLPDAESDTAAPQFADPHSVDFQARLESMAEVLRAVQMFTDLDCQEYPRLFFTSDVLRPLKEEDAVPPEDYCRVLQRMEEILWNRIFVLGYIDFTFVPPPPPDCLRNLLRARLQRPLQDATIAAYKKVSAAAVSYQRKRYTAAQRAWFTENGFDA